MKRRNFIKNTALAATMVGIAPSVMAYESKVVKKKKMIIVLRGVSYLDAENAFKKSGLKDSNIHFQKVICTNRTFTHQEGFNNIVSGHNRKCTITQSQKCNRYQFSQLVPGSIATTDKNLQIIYFHQTEIGHSSNKLYVEKLNEFFNELKNVFDPHLHQFIITADIGRNEMLNSCGGRDHSNETCLETFVLFMGGNTSILKSNSSPINQFQILEQNF